MTQRIRLFYSIGKAAAIVTVGCHGSVLGTAAVVVGCIVCEAVFTADYVVCNTLGYSIFFGI